MAKRGRPPAGPGGVKVEDLPRVTIRLDPEILERARQHARETERPLWRLVQDLLRAHLDGDLSPAVEFATDVEPVEPPQRREASPAAGKGGIDVTQTVRQVELGREDVKLLRRVLMWRLEGREDAELARLRGTLADVGVADWSAELPLEDCRRLRRALAAYLKAGKDRLEVRLEQVERDFYRAVEDWKKRGKEGTLPRKLEERVPEVKREHRAENGRIRRLQKAVPGPEAPRTSRISSAITSDDDHHPESSPLAVRRQTSADPVEDPLRGPGGSIGNVPRCWSEAQ